MNEKAGQNSPNYSSKIKRNEFCFVLFFNKDNLRDLLEKALVSHSSTLAWKILWTEEPGRLQSMGSLRVGHD